jgi:hypothetical protein
MPHSESAPHERARKGSPAVPELVVVATALVVVGPDVVVAADPPLPLALSSPHPMKPAPRAPAARSTAEIRSNFIDCLPS